MVREFFAVEDPLDDAQAAFLAPLRARAGGWPIDAGDEWVLLPGYESYGPVPSDGPDGRLLVVVDVVADGSSVCTLGAYLDRERVRGDKVHNQLFILPGTPTPLAFSSQGTPAELGERTADWFGVQLRRPVERQEWLRDGRLFARQWRFADLDLPLVAWGRLGEVTGPPDLTVQVRP